MNFGAMIRSGTAFSGTGGAYENTPTAAGRGVFEREKRKKKEKKKKFMKKIESCSGVPAPLN